MLRRISLCTSLLLVAGALAAAEPPAVQSVSRVDVRDSEATAPPDAAASGPANAGTGTKTLSGISILGNQEAPKALVIVPWKSSQLGDTLGIDRTLDDSRQPVDRDVFMRELTYYEIRSGAK